MFRTRMLIALHCVMDPRHGTVFRCIWPHCWCVKRLSMHHSASECIAMPHISMGQPCSEVGGRTSESEPSLRVGSMCVVRADQNMV